MCQVCDGKCTMCMCQVCVHKMECVQVECGECGVEMNMYVCKCAQVKVHDEMFCARDVHLYCGVGGVS